MHGFLYDSMPDIHMKAYDVIQNLVTVNKNTTMLGDCFLHYTSDVSYYDNTQSAWVVPEVFATNVVDTNYTGPVDYHYSNCGTFVASDFSVPANVYRAAGTTGIKQNNIANNIGQNYPNPFSQSTSVSVKLPRSNNIDFKVYNTLGNLVYVKEISGQQGDNIITMDAVNLSAGVYYYTIKIGLEESVTNKMIIEK